MLDKTIREFCCTPLTLVYNTENFKIYGAEYNKTKYPYLKENKYGNISLIGNIHELGLGIEYYVKAEEQKSKGNYGYQYKVISIRRERPTNNHTTYMFLSEILTIDQVKTIMDNYPDIVDRVINNRLDDIDLSKLHNIKEYRFKVIKRKIEENFMFAEIIEMFQGLINMSTVKVLYDKYASTLKVKQVIQQEPYECLCSLSGIGFKTADNIILTLDKETKLQKQQGKIPSVYFNFDVKHSEQRAMAATDYLLAENESNGHTKMSIVELRNLFNELVPECGDKFIDVLKSPKFFIEKESKTISLLETYQTELYIANTIKNGLKVENKWDHVNLEDFNMIGDKELTNEQFNAVKMLYNNNISILNGYGGSGKSFTTQAILNMVKRLNKTFWLMCPTGRASKVLSAYTQEDAKTIHRGLLFNPSDDPQWGYNEDEKLPYDVVIVDEMSMTDVFLMKRLLEAIDFKTTKLLFIGDGFQIPSVGAGNVLHDMVNSDIIPVTSLTKIFRYGVGGVLTVATKTRLGEEWITDTDKYNIFGEDNGYIYMPMSQEKIMGTLKTLYTKLMNNGSKPEDILVLSSYNIGDYGTIRINNEIQQIANKNYGKGESFKSGEITYYLDDIVIQTVNNYKAIVYNGDQFDLYDDDSQSTFICNGDIGKVVIIDREYMVVQFDNEKIIYDREAALNLKLSYSISTHKAQGGSCENIILITPKAHTHMLNANLIYVGQTRATKRCYHLGEPQTINRAIKKQANLNRKTHLKELLKSL